MAILLMTQRCHSILACQQQHRNIYNQEFLYVEIAFLNPLSVGKTYSQPGTLSSLKAIGIKERHLQKHESP
jgi:hypothetical protein